MHRYVHHKYELPAIFSKYFEESESIRYHKYKTKKHDFRCFLLILK